ncbi:MAG TPA: lysylphosphatidylglycerol synthase transmembrane domain-containing protein [Polyangiaceae bacterium]
MSEAAAAPEQVRRLRLGRVLSWMLALVALAFVAWVVPVRDRCWDPHAPRSTRVSVTRDDAGCVLHLRTGDVREPAEECASLQCEPGLASTVEHARLGVAAGLLALYFLSTLAWAARWRALLAFADVELPVLEVWRVSIEAQAGGILLPGGIGGDALRIASVVSRPTRHGTKAPASIVIASVLLDRAVGLSTIAALAAALGLGLGGGGASPNKAGTGPLALVLAAIPVAVAAGLFVLRAAPVDRIPWLVRGRVGGVVQPVLAYVRDPRALRAIAVAVGLSFVVAAVQLAVVRGLVVVVGGTPLSEKWVYVGTAMAFIVAAIPALPGGWGTADAAYVFFFGLAGIPVGAALAMCLLYRLFWYLSGVAGAVLHLARARR